MSAPSNDFNNANHLSIALLAATTNGILQQALTHNLSEDDIDSLSQAHAFVMKVRDGLSLIEGRYWGSSCGGLMSSLDAVGLAMAPIEAFPDEQTQSYLDRIAAVLQSCIKNKNVLAVQKEDRLLSQAFFSLLADSMIGSFSSAISHDKRNDGFQVSFAQAFA